MFTAKPRIALSGMALCPLPVTLFPGGRISLQTTEGRYQAEFQACHFSNTPFGIVTLAQKDQERLTSGTSPENFYLIGTLARITVFKHLDSGLMLAECAGGQRFRIHVLKSTRIGLWITDASLLVPDLHVPIPNDLKPAARALHRTLNAAIPGGGSHEGSNAPSFVNPQFGHYDDCGWVANRWSELLPMPLADRQRLMALENPLLRLELVTDSLGRMGLIDVEN